MRIDIVGRHLEITDAIRTHAETRCEKLPRYYDGVQQITFNISQGEHQQRGPFTAELIIDVEKHEDFISAATGDDLYAVIDQVVHKGVRQLTDFKAKLRDTHR